METCLSLFCMHYIQARREQVFTERQDSVACPMCK